MKLLLDTHIWRWTMSDPERLGKRMRAAITRPGVELWLSPISVWELLVLADRGRIKLTPTPRAWVDEALRRTPVQEAPINHQVAIRSREILSTHDDPADRFLVATALIYGLTLATADEVLIRSKVCPVLANR